MEIPKEVQPYYEDFKAIKPYIKRRVLNDEFSEPYIDFPKEDVPYYDDLVIIREELEKTVEDFPNGKCDLAARVVHAVKGVPYTVGYFLRFVVDAQAYNIDPLNSVNLCIALDQFWGVHDKVVVSPWQQPFLTEEPKFLEEHKFFEDEAFFECFGVRKLVEYLQDDMEKIS